MKRGAGGTHGGSMSYGTGKDIGMKCKMSPKEAGANVRMSRLNEGGDLAFKGRRGKYASGYKKGK